MCANVLSEIEVGAGKDGAAVRPPEMPRPQFPLEWATAITLTHRKQANVKLQTPSLHDVVQARLFSSLFFYCGLQLVIFGNTQTYLSMPELVFRETHKHTTVIVGDSSTR